MVRIQIFDLSMKNFIFNPQYPIYTNNLLFLTCMALCNTVFTEFNQEKLNTKEKISKKVMYHTMCVNYDAKS